MTARTRTPNQGALRRAQRLAAVIDRWNRVGSWVRVGWLRLRYPACEIGSGVEIERGTDIRFHPTARVTMRDCIIRRGAMLRAGPDAELVIGPGTTLAPRAVVAATASIRIGEGCAVAEMVVIRDQDHVMDPPRPLAETGLRSVPVVIGSHSWIGAGSAVLKGVEVGEFAIVAAGAVVTRSVPAGAVVGGVPAKPLR